MSDATYYDGLTQGETYERTRVIAYLQREAETYRRVSGPHQTEPLEVAIRRLVEAIENDRHWAEDSESNHA